MDQFKSMGAVGPVDETHPDLVAAMEKVTSYRASLLKKCASYRKTALNNKIKELLKENLDLSAHWHMPATDDTTPMETDMDLETEDSGFFDDSVSYCSNFTREDLSDSSITKIAEISSNLKDLHTVLSIIRSEKCSKLHVLMNG